MATEKAVLFTLCLEEFESSDSGESESSDDDVTAAILHLQKRKKRPRQLQLNYVEKVVANFTIDEFKTFFRISGISVQSLKEIICDICITEDISGILSRHSSGGSEQIPLDNRLLILLWYMASLDKYASIADRFGISESTASGAIRNLLQFVQENLVKRVITWPNDDESEEIQDMYSNLKHFPGVIGMIDGTHIRIHKPSVRGVDYYNRKDFYSVVLQAVVREDMRFTNVFTGYPGKVHDARVLKESPLYQTANFDRNVHILGDSGYPNLPWLLAPFRDNGHLTDAQKKYNKVHSSIRSVVERAFGLLKGRFTRLQNVNVRDVRTVVQTILAGCVLHNICIDNNEDLVDLYTDQFPDVPADPGYFSAHDQEVAACKRLQIAHMLL